MPTFKTMDPGPKNMDTSDPNQVYPGAGVLENKVAIHPNYKRVHSLRSRCGNSGCH